MRVPNIDDIVPESAEEALKPAPMVPRAGRKATKRIRSNRDTAAGGGVKRLKCGHCHQLGHNSRTCTKGLVEAGL